MKTKSSAYPLQRKVLHGLPPDPSFLQENVKHHSSKNFQKSQTPIYKGGGATTGFDLMSRDSYFTIPVEVFMNNISAENTCFTNHIVNRTQDCGLKTYKYLANYLLMSKFWKHSYRRFPASFSSVLSKNFSEPKRTNCKDETVNLPSIYLLFDLLGHQKSIS